MNSSSNREEEELSFNGGFSDEEETLSRVAGEVNSNFGRLRSSFEPKIIQINNKYIFYYYLIF